MPPNGRRGSRCDQRVDERATGLELARDALAPRRVSCEHGGPQPEHAVIGQSHGVRFVAGLDDRRPRDRTILRRRPACRASHRPALSADRTSPYPEESRRPDRTVAPFATESSTCLCRSSRRSRRACGPTSVPSASGSPIFFVRIIATIRSVNAARRGSTMMKRLALTQL